LASDLREFYAGSLYFDYELVQGRILWWQRWIFGFYNEIFF